MAADHVPGWHLVSTAPASVPEMIPWVRKRAIWLREWLVGRFTSDFENEISREFSTEPGDPWVWKECDPKDFVFLYSRRVAANVRYWMEHFRFSDFPLWRDLDGDNREAIKLDVHFSETLSFLHKIEKLGSLPPPRTTDLDKLVTLPQVAFTESNAKISKDRNELSSTKCLILLAVQQLKAMDETTKITCPEIGKKVGMDPDARLRSELAALRDLKLLGGAKGTRGYWLTHAGVDVAQSSSGAR
ncbi:MAG: hypothetical protein ACKVP0_10275 [Pirellulaceae bacterium]